MEQRFAIGELAKEFDVTTRTIRFYEAEGLLNPERDGQTRIYSDQDRIRLKLILRGKRLGFTLSESKELIDLYEPEGANNKQLYRFLEKIQERRSVLAQQVNDIEIMLGELEGAEQRCREALNFHADIVE